MWPLYTKHTQRIRFPRSRQQLSHYKLLFCQIWAWAEELAPVFKCYIAAVGHISEEEFSEACSVLCQHTGTVLTKDQIKNMASAMDQNKDGQIDFNEFLEAFRIVDQQHTMEVRRGQAKS